MGSFTLASTSKGDDNVLGESWDRQPALKLLHSERARHAPGGGDYAAAGPTTDYTTAHAAGLIIVYDSTARSLPPSRSSFRPLLNYTHIHHGRNTHRYRRAHPIANASLLTPSHSPRRRYRFPQGWFRRHGMSEGRTIDSMRTLLRHPPRTSPTTNTPP